MLKRAAPPAPEMMVPVLLTCSAITVAGRPSVGPGRGSRGGGGGEEGDMAPLRAAAAAAGDDDADDDPPCP